MVQSNNMKASSEEVVSKKRTPRKRVSAKRAASPESKPALRKRVATNIDSQKPVFKSESRVTAPKSSSRARKAPTGILADKEIKKGKRKQKIIVGLLLVISIGASAAVGLSDDGQINVTKTIEDRNERIRNNTADARDTLVSNVELPVQNTSGRSAGGLRPATAAEKSHVPDHLPVPEISTTTATSSDDVASSTEDGSASTADTIDDTGLYSQEESIGEEL